MMAKLDSATVNETTAALPPTEPSKKMAKQAMRHGRQWVWLPAEAPVRKKGATHWLKPAVWYQAKIDGDGNRVFYDKQGKLVGRTLDEVQVKIWGTEVKALDEDPPRRAC